MTRGLANRQCLATCVAAIISAIALTYADVQPAIADADWTTYTTQADQAMSAGKYADAIAAAKAGYAVVQRDYGAESGQSGTLLFLIGEAEYFGGHPADATEPLHQALTILRSSAAEFRSMIPWAEAMSGLCAGALKNSAEAESDLRTALADARRLANGENAQIAQIAEFYASQLVADKNHDLAPAAMADARRLYAQFVTAPNQLLALDQLVWQYDELMGDDAQEVRDLATWRDAATGADGGSGPLSRNALTASVNFDVRTGKSADLAAILPAKTKLDEAANDRANLLVDYQQLSAAAWTSNLPDDAIAYAQKTLSLTNGLEDPLTRTVDMSTRHFLQSLYQQTGQIDRARQQLADNLRIDRQLFGESSEPVALDLSARAISDALLDPKGALADAAQSVRMIEAVPAPNYSSSRPIIYVTAAEVYGAQGQVQPAVEFGKKGLAATSDPELADIASAILAFLDMEAGRGADALAVLDAHGRGVAQGSAGPSTFADGFVHFVRMNAELSTTNYAAALQESRMTTAAWSGFNQSSEFNLLINEIVARAHWGLGDGAAAREDFRKGVGAGIDSFNSSVLLETERRRYLDELGTIFDAIESFVASDPRNDANAELLVDTMLARKGIVPHSIAVRSAEEQNARAPNVAALVARLAVERDQAAGLGMRQNAALGAQLSEDERALTRLLPRSDLGVVTWRDVQARLKPGEVAVDVSQFVRELKPGVQGDVWYVAVVVLPSGPPHAVVLGSAANIEVASLRSYVQTIGLAQTLAPTGDAYTRLWAPIQPLLGGAHVVYLAADGILDLMNPALIRAPSGGYLLDDIDLRVVSSLRDVLRDRSQPATKTATIIADPAFDGNPNAPCADAIAASERNTAGVPVRLCASRTEATTVESELSRDGYTVNGPYLGNDATKQRILSADHPAILHIATHGFFVQEKAPALGLTLMGAFDTASNADPLLRSGLLLANSASAARSETYSGSGVLTAYEAVGAPLAGTELVVLSACDTGIGQLDYNGQGSYSLPMAFLEAGARSVMMSMWSVPDRETNELMGRFYHYWAGDHLEEHAALRAAELDERKTVIARYGHDEPALWGAFVLYGN